MAPKGGSFAIHANRSMLQWGLTLSSEEKLNPIALTSMDLLQWGLTLSSEETASYGRLPPYPRLKRASMGPHSFERGNCRGNSVPRPAGFNGASLFRARKLLPYTTCPELRGASMGPHSFEQGNSDILKSGPRFNGASLFRARKQPTRLDYRRPEP